MTKPSVRTGAWVRRFHPAADTATRLICFPHAGGSATYYFPMSQAMSPAVEVLAVQYPGRQDRRTEPCVEDVHELADLAIEEVRSWTDRPFALFGHSLGASLAFEIARRLERDGRTPLALFASGRRAPSQHRAEQVHLLDDAGLVAELKKLSGTDARMLGDEEILQMILPSLRSDYTAAETYRVRPGPRLNCPIVALIGTDDPQVTQDEAAAWSEHTTAAFALRVFPGGHFFLNDHAKEVIKELTETLADRTA